MNAAKLRAKARTLRITAYQLEDDIRIGFKIARSLPRAHRAHARALEAQAARLGGRIR